MWEKAEAWQAVICERRGDFELAAEWTRVARLDPEMHWFAINLHGHLLLASGRFGEAAREFRRSRFAAVQQGLAVDEIDSIQDEAWAAGFAGAENAGQLAAEAISLSGRVIGAGSVARARSRLALTMLGQADPELIKDQLRQSVAGLEAAGYHSDCADPLFVQCILGCVIREDEYAAASVRLLEELVQTHGAHRHMLLMAKRWIGKAFPRGDYPEPDFAGIRWLDHEEGRLVCDRWDSVMNRLVLGPR